MEDTEVEAFFFLLSTLKLDGLSGYGQSGNINSIGDKRGTICLSTEDDLDDLGRNAIWVLTYLYSNEWQLVFSNKRTN